MQIEVPTFLRLAEQAKRILFVDLEATGLRGDYNSVLCVSMRPYGEKSITSQVEKPGNDKKCIAETIEIMNDFDAWVTYYGKGFDIPMINTRAMRWCLKPLCKKPHIDMYYSLKSNLLTARRSQGHLLDWLRIEANDTTEESEKFVKKMSVSADEWNHVLSYPHKAMPIMVKRCESDTYGLMNLYERTKHVLRDIKA